MQLPRVLRRVAERSPFPVMVRALMERCLNPHQLDAWFAHTAQAQYTRKLLFSQLFGLMIRVVLRQKPSIHAACLAEGAHLGASLTAVYNKLNGLELGTSAALVGYAGAQAEALIGALGGARAPLLPGVRVKVLDGNSLGGREHRLRETRTRAPLPGKALVVFDPALEVITALYPCADAYTQERALLGPVLADIHPGELLIADRNFATRDVLDALAARGAWSLIRVREGVRFTPREPLRAAGRVQAGTVTEQWGQLGAKPPPDGLRLRRIALHLDRPTRDGERTVYLLSSLPAAYADACRLAALYRHRWTLEKAFLHLTTQLRCEVDTLSYPPAAVFALACAMVTYNVLGVVKAALRAARGLEFSEQISGYHLAVELANMAESLDTLLDPQDWAVFQRPSTAVLAA